VITSSPPDAHEVWHPYWFWEEFYFNMWGGVADRKEWLQRAIDFTGDPELYGNWMKRVAKEWPYSCAHNLTKRDTNRKAWIGHAAVALAIQCPEDIVREAWGHLSREQQNMANTKAQQAIDYWEKESVKDRP
jgi:hypothetical protein